MSETLQTVLSVYAIGFLIVFGLLYDINTDCGEKKALFKDVCAWLGLSLLSWVMFFRIYFYYLSIKIKDYFKD